MISMKRIEGARKVPKAATAMQRIPKSSHSLWFMRTLKTAITSPVATPAILAIEETKLAVPTRT